MRAELAQLIREQQDVLVAELNAARSEARALTTANEMAERPARSVRAEITVARSGASAYPRSSGNAVTLGGTGQGRGPGEEDACFLALEDRCTISKAVKEGLCKGMSDPARKPRLCLSRSN